MLCEVRRDRRGSTVPGAPGGHWVESQAKDQTRVRRERQRSRHHQAASPIVVICGQANDNGGEREKIIILASVVSTGVQGQSQVAGSGLALGQAYVMRLGLQLWALLSWSSPSQRSMIPDGFLLVWHPEGRSLSVFQLWLFTRAPGASDVLLHNRRMASLLCIPSTCRTTAITA